jgi:hypothetical protein
MWWSSVPMALRVSSRTVLAPPPLNVESELIVTSLSGLLIVLTVAVDQGVGHRPYLSQSAYPAKGTTVGGGFSKGLRSMREICWAIRCHQGGGGLVLTPRQPAPSQNCPAGSRLRTARTSHTIAVPDHCSITAPSVVSVVPRIFHLSRVTLSDVAGLRFTRSPCYDRDCVRGQGP